jgi:aldehyde:ferredoxin oxidoreductase
MWYGYAGRLGIVDLSTGNVTERELDEGLISGYLGGRGFIAKLLYDLVPAHVDPLGPENALIFAVGPLNGTLAPTSGRVTVGAKSPLTGVLGSGNAGGFWGPQLKWAGYDGLVILGRAAEPAYVVVRSEGIDIVPARHLWGKDVQETERLIRQEQGDSELSVACSGTAGDHCVALSTVMFDRVRSAGRGGMGAVMGSKNLKAIAVHGTGAVRIHDPTRFWTECSALTKKAIDKGYRKSRQEGGTYGAFTRWNEKGALQTFNGQFGQFPGVEKISGKVFNDGYRLRMRACFGCPLACWPTYVIREGPYAGLYAEEVTATTFKETGARCGVDDMDVILKAHTLMNLYGLDTISAPAAIAFAMECYQREIIETKDTGGLELEWGRGDVVLDLIEQMGHNEGLGGELGAGVRACARNWGSEAEKYALHVKGMEVVGTDPRGMPAWGLGYATSTRGACHMRAYSNFEYGGVSDEEMIRIGGTTAIADRTGWEGKGRAVAYLENMRAYGDSLELCILLTRGEFGFPEQLVGLLESATGRHIEPEELFRIGERIYNVEHLFNLREGSTPADDTLPERFLSEPMPKGPMAGSVCPLGPMLQEYYQARDWDPITGCPSPEKRRELGI